MCSGNFAEMELTRRHCDTATQNNPRVIIIGLGNPLLGDDGIGWRVVEQLEHAIKNYKLRIKNYEFDYHAGGGLSLMERLSGYDDAIIVDAINTGRAPIGTVSVMSLDELPNPALGHFGSSHETNLQTALQVGRALNASLPNQITVVAIEAQEVYDFSETLSPALADAVPRAVESVLNLLHKQLDSEVAHSRI